MLKVDWIPGILKLNQKKLSSDDKHHKVKN